MSSPQNTTDTRQPEPAHLLHQSQQASLETSQPPSFQPMNPQQPHPDSELTLRGGDRGGMCPGRFCFCIPCPLPCDFCII
ncbi:hypothetical protein NKR19_g4077 [Coniochaeta hoffmannii]|uniref:Uncharacterized protein n=1 Tax=Coniochaeta hoffmannii TaxID=91930 RepID=A0AA38S626_9PEZI|nr:hypothetical protein NKR19_g4077 [Coniochaeta hoffmannii]